MRSSSPPRQGVNRHRSLGLDDIFGTRRKKNEEDDEEGSRYGVNSTIYHTNRHSDDVSEAGNQSLSSVRRNSITKKSAGRRVVKRTTSRSVEFSTSASAASGLIHLLSPTPMRKEDFAHCHDETAAQLEDKQMIAESESMTRKLPPRSQSADSMLGHKARGAKRGETSTRRTTTSRRSFAHTNGLSKTSAKKDPSIDRTNNRDRPKESYYDESPTFDTAIDEEKNQRRRQIHTSKPSESSQELKLSDHSRSRDDKVRRHSSRQSSNRSRQHSGSRAESEQEHKDKRPAPPRTSSRMSASTSSYTDDLKSPSRRSSAKDSNAKRPVPSRTRSGRHHRKDSKTSQNGVLRGAEHRQSPMNKHRSNHKTSNSSYDVSPERLTADKDDYGYGPGSPGRGSANTDGQCASRSNDSDGSSSRSRYDADRSPTDDDDSSGDDEYAKQYAPTTRKEKDHDDDEDTVLQFDPSHHDGVQEVRKARTTQYEIEIADGVSVRSVVGQIVELANPVDTSQVLAAQYENNKLKEPLFGFPGVNKHQRDEDSTSISSVDDDLANFGGEVRLPIEFHFHGGEVGLVHEFEQDTSDPFMHGAREETEDDDPLSPSQGGSPGKMLGARRKLSKKFSEPELLGEKTSVRVGVGASRDMPANKVMKVVSKTTASDGKAMETTKKAVNTKPKRSPMSTKYAPSPLLKQPSGHLQIFSSGGSDELNDDDDGDSQAGVEFAFDLPPTIQSEPKTTKSPVKEPESPKKAIKKKGKRLSGIGRYFGRNKRSNDDDDDDMMSVGSTSIGFFNPVKAKHQLLDDDDDESFDSGVF